MLFLFNWAKLANFVLQCTEIPFLEGIDASTSDREHDELQDAYEDAMMSNDITVEFRDLSCNKLGYLFLSGPNVGISVLCRSDRGYPSYRGWGSLIQEPPFMATWEHV